ncbi:pyridoxamine 5'-phosphate oxidase family protein [Arthrobacter sp. yr096]|uniref:pyridoxamine 5'-phosphate oxidase family protein n=1 Tax=Arthrobacter sp. yr096 TaxID=1761750 RepID=UPI000B89EC37|nr:pyridoxamine 5'-phosphate oxidase family protein [Arthrobacter sp. yr096]
MENTSMDQDVKELSVHDCWKYLQSVSIGRIALINGEEPEIFPMNFVPNYGTVLFRTGPGTKLDALREGAVIALEADGFNRYGTVAWSVILKGSPEFVTQPEDIQEAVDAGLSPWQPGAKDVLVRVTPTEISGRRFVIAPPSKWWPPLDPTASDVDDGETQDAPPGTSG